jgi:peptidoglycan/xylan/chitin deacetylase (PgdA/CDA1 family)
VILAFSFALSTGFASAADEAVVLLYHRFGEDQHPATSVTIDQFEAHLEYLAANGYAVVPLAEVVASVRGRAELPERAVAITIDDGYRSVYEQAWPRLRRYGFPFTVFVVTDPVDAHRPDSMTWDQMREMQADGVSFANHGSSHRSFVRRRGVASEVDRLQRVRADVEQAARRLDVELSPLEGVIAYPFGEYDTSVAELVADLGYVAFGQHSGVVGPTSDPRALPRFPMAQAWAAIDDFAVKVAARPLPVVAVEPWDPVTVSRRPRLEVTLAENTDARLDQLACYVGGQGEVPVEWLDGGRRFAVTPRNDLDYGRARVNCTAPAAEGGRFHWFCHPWIVRSREGP